MCDDKTYLEESHDEKISLDKVYKKEYSGTQNSLYL